MNEAFCVRELLPSRSIIAHQIDFSFERAAPEATTIAGEKAGGWFFHRARASPIASYFLAVIICKDPATRRRHKWADVANRFSGDGSCLFFRPGAGLLLEEKVSRALDEVADIWALSDSWNEYFCGLLGICRSPVVSVIKEEFFIVPGKFYI